MQCLAGNMHIFKKVQSQCFALQELLEQFLPMLHYGTGNFLSYLKKCKASALHSKNCLSNSCRYSTTMRAISYPIKKRLYQRYNLF